MMNGKTKARTFELLDDDMLPIDTILAWDDWNEVIHLGIWLMITLCYCLWLKHRVRAEQNLKTCISTGEVRRSLLPTGGI